MPTYKSVFLKEDAVKNLKELMKERGVTQKYLAELLGIKPAAVSKNLSLENNSFFEYHRMVTIARLFTVKVEDLFPVRIDKF